MTMGTGGVPNTDRRVRSSFPPLFRRLPRRRHRGRSAIDSVDTLWREYLTRTILLWNLRDRQSLVGSSQP